MGTQAVEILKRSPQRAEQCVRTHWYWRTTVLFLVGIFAGDSAFTKKAWPVSTSLGFFLMLVQMPLQLLGAGMGVVFGHTQKDGRLAGSIQRLAQQAEKFG